MKNIKMQKGFTIIEFMFFVLVGAIIVGGAYYVGSQKDKNESNSTETAQQQSATNDDPYQGWKTFKDERLGIELMHPTDWVAETNANIQEPFLGTSFGENHTYYGDIEIKKSGEDISTLYGHVFGKESVSYDQLTKEHRSEYASINPFKEPKKEMSLVLGQGRGIVLNQVTDSYSDLIFILDVTDKLFWLNFREQTVKNPGNMTEAASTDYTQYSNDVINIVKSIKKI